MSERKITKLLQKFLGNNVDVSFGGEFACILGTGEITWGIGESVVVNGTWAYRLWEDYGFELTNENVFVLSILHEAGHYMTEDDFSEDEWEVEIARKATIEKEMTRDNFWDKNQEYYLLPTEKAATDWAIEAFRSHKPEMRKWCHRLNCAIKHYEKKTGKVVFERFHIDKD